MSEQRICEGFNITGYLVWLTRNLMKFQGVLPDVKKDGNRLNHEVVSNVNKFYEEGESSQLCSGKKDCVLLGGQFYKQKRLILFSLNELFVSF